MCKVFFSLLQVKKFIPPPKKKSTNVCTVVKVNLSTNFLWVCICIVVTFNTNYFREYEVYNLNN